MSRAMTAAAMFFAAHAILQSPAEARHCCKRYYSAFSYHFPAKATPPYRPRGGYRYKRAYHAGPQPLFLGGYRYFPVYTPYVYWNGAYGFYPRFDNRNFFERVISGPYVGKGGGFQADF